MAKKPKYVRQYLDRHGVTRLEFRRRGHQGWPLRQPLRSREFQEDYEAAIRGEVPPGVAGKRYRGISPPQQTKQGSLGWLIQEYKRSAAFKSLAASTRSVRARILDRLTEKYGDFPYATLDKPAVLKLRDQLSDRPEAANARLKALRQIYKHALEYGVEGVSHDPTRDVSYLRPRNPDGFYAWSKQELAQFERHHSVGTKARLALALMLYGGCARRSDVVKLGKQHLEDGRLVYKQFKGRHRNPVQMDIPVIDELQRIIDASPCGDLTFLVTKFGRPFTANGFGNWFKKRCREAGLPHCSAHGVRKAMAARLAELGCSDHEIMAIGGWKTLKEVERYTKSADRRRMSDLAMERVQAHIDGTKVSNLGDDANQVRQTGSKR